MGLDASGKTTILYKMILGEIVTTIPTIGFNVETISNVSNANLVCWDVGGCDKIRPLWRHYYANTSGLIFVIDSNDRERLLPQESDYDHNTQWYYNAKGMFDMTLNEDELRDTVVLIFFNKQDLPNAMSVAEMTEKLGLRNIRNRQIHIQPCCATTGDGLILGFEWLVQALNDKKNGVNLTKTDISELTLGPTAAVIHPPTLLETWLEREDQPDEVFLSQVADYSLDAWDHYNHLRLAYLILVQYGRADGLPRIFELIERFIENSPRTKSSAANTRGTTFHMTMTFFWVHMVHYAIAATRLPPGESHPAFKIFLAMNPQLSMGGLFLEYYSKQLMLMDPKSRKEIMLPDIKQLPSLVPPSLLSSAMAADDMPSISSPRAFVSAAKTVVDIHLLSDAQLFLLFCRGELSAWGHIIKLRLVYIMLMLYGRAKGGVDKVLQRIQSVEKEHFHLTLSYCWIQLVTFSMAALLRLKGLKQMWRYGALPDGGDTEAASESDAYATRVQMVLSNVMSFTEFMQQCNVHIGVIGIDLEDPEAYAAFYSDAVLDNEMSKDALSLPDKKPFPSVV